MNHKLYCFLLLGALYASASALDCDPPHYFSCDNNSKCILSTFKCDGDPDCVDKSDETNCENFTLPPILHRCADDEYKCNDRSCIPVEKFCDGFPDCSDVSDEYDDCAKKLKCTEFRCKSGHCVSNEWVCDGIADCEDKSDEIDCDKKIIPTEECNNKNDRFLCKNQRCIFLGMTCNKLDNCGDGSDEDLAGCTKAEEECSKTARCNQICRRTPQGAACSCRPGYELATNETCKDVNECAIYGTCDQHCINNDGLYVCACSSGYTLQEDRKTCKADGGEALMIYSSKSEVQGYYLTSKLSYSIARDLQHAVSVSLDANYVYWSDIEDGNEAIFKSLEDGSRRQVIVSAGLGKPENIAVDWITGNIYFTDSSFLHIGVCTNNGSYCTVIIKNLNGYPRSLALLPSEGILYWSEWGLNAGSRISAAGMDGKYIQPFITSNLEWPNDITIDYPSERLYWLDAKSKIIESVRLDGTDRRTVLSRIAKHPFSLEVFENKLYWSDWSTNTIQSCDKHNGKDWETIIRQNSTIYGIHIYHSVLKPKVHNPCSAEPCAQLCLLNRATGYTCACTLDRELSPDQHTCRALQKKEHILIAAGNKFIDYYHELLGAPKMTESTTMRQVTTMAYNSLTGSVFASDQLADKIFHYNPRSGDAKTIISLRSELVGGMDFDYIGNNLYVTDREQRTIEVHSLSTNQKTVFYFQEEPYDIALIPKKGLMYVVFRTTSGTYRIDKMQMSGFGSTFSFTDNTLIGPKISLSYDKDTNRIFWSDQGTGRIESATIQGTDRYLFRTGLTGPVDLLVLNERVFWTQFQSNHLYWTMKNSTYQFQKRVSLPNVPKNVKIMHLAALRSPYVPEEHTCRKNNGNCSHVCLVSNVHLHTCACPPDMALNPDNRTCSPQSICGKGEMKCGHDNTCIKRNQLCDGHVDCPMGEDEAQHCSNQNSCGQEEFQCNNGECISLKKRCNYHYDCMDRSDEMDCIKKQCKTNEFQCHEGNCISRYLVCNGQMDCDDGSDEIACALHTCSSEDFACNDKNCIPLPWKCDGQRDCPDGSDEGEHCIKKCPPEMFTCKNGRCLEASLTCNNANDCGDNSDEEQCMQNRNVNAANCTAEQYNCYNTQICVPARARCNGLQDCPKNDDEHNCKRCLEDEFVCNNGKCIPPSWVCDRQDDCGDKSDEKDCTGDKTKVLNIDTSFSCPEFRCDSGECISYSLVCDGKVNCRDRSDEQGKCTFACVKDNPCDSLCYKTPNGPVCGCQAGYRLRADGKSCEDIDECKTDVCSQVCQNTVGSFVCSCYDGYVLRNDKISCKAIGNQMELITVVRNYIRRLTPTLSKIEVLHQESAFEVSGIDVDASKNTIYWSNDALGMITKMNLETRAKHIVSGIGVPCGLAVDWTTSNVYFNDNAPRASIKVCNLEQQKCARLLTIEGTKKPVSIAISPKHGWLFWSQTSWSIYDDSSSEIYRTDLVGANATVIAYKHVGVVSGLAIDHMRARLYWSDSFLRTVEVSDFDGSNRRTFMKTDYQPFGVNMWEDALYWVVGDSGNLQKCNVYNDKSCTLLSLGSTNINGHFVVLHPARQPVVMENVCQNSTCEYMCIPRNNIPVCICENGYPDNSKSTCVTMSDKDVKFVSSTVRQKASHIHQESSTVIGIVVTVITCIIGVSAYCYYQKVKPNLMKKNDLSIRFQNPTYSRHNEIVTPLNCVSNLPPGEHEYSNPIINISKNRNGRNNEKTGESLCDDKSDSDSDATYRQSINLIN